MARERSIVVRLKAEVASFNQAIQSSARTLSEFEREQQRMGGASTTTLGRMVQSARANEQAWQTTGRTLLGVGGAITGIGVAALKTGIQYNTLQQTSRAALTTLLGSAEAANAQMDKLDDFARTSPFAKQVFIEAQRQMIGFGIEAGKVLPYLDAIQNAVAATGGSNQDIAELARIFSTVSANAKLTARDLMMFGQRGVDAASIIGSQMGKTGAQIRDEITAGTLDADAALDALATGMQDRFGGAAENIKNTLEGAWDRVKAAWRDLSSELAAPLVGPEGGGLAITVLNKLADAMRQFEDAPGWLKGATAGVAGLVGAVSLGAGAFMLALPKWVAFQSAVSTLAASHPMLGKFTQGLGRFAATAGKVAAWGTAAVIAAKGMTAIYNSSRPAAAGVNELELALRKANFDEAFSHLSGSYNTLDDAWRALTSSSPVDWLDRQFSSLNQAFGGPLPDDVKAAADGFEAMGEALAQMYQSGDADLAAAEFRALADSLNLTGGEVDQLLNLMPAYREVLAGTEVDATRAADGADSLADGTDAAGEAAERAAAKMEEWISIVEGAGASFGGILDAYDAVISKNDDMALSTSQTMDQWIAELQNQANAVGAWRDNYMTALDQIRTEVPVVARSAHKDFVDEMLAAGEEGAAALQTFVDGTPEQRAQLVRAWQGAGYEIQELIEEGNEPMEFEVNTDGAQSLFQQMIGDWETTETETNLSANTDPGKDRANALMGDWENTTTETFLSADPAPAVRVFNQQTGAWENTTTDTLLDLNPNEAVSVFNRETGTWQRTTTATLLNMDPAKAKRMFGINTSSWRNTTTNTGLGMNTSSASGTFSSARSKWRNTTTSTGLGLNTSSARSSFSGFRAWLAGQSLTKTITVIEKPGKYEGGFISKGLYTGGTVLPGRMAGGRVPGTRAGYDNVMWPLHSGGRVLTQPLEGGEYVVRSSQANRADYAPILEAMNRGTFQAAPGPSVVVSSLSDSDVARIAVAVREGAAVGSERGTRVGAREGLDATSRRAAAGYGQNLGW